MLDNSVKFLKKLSFKILLFLEILVSSFLNLFFIFCISGTVCAEQTILGNNWMSGLSDDTKLCDINIPGTHDSGTTYTTAVISGIIASCQDDTIPEQLQKGIRYLDIRCDGDLDINHGGVACYSNILTIKKYKLTFKKVLDDIEKFLDENPSETVMLQFKHEGVSKKDFLKKVNDLLKTREKLYKPQTSRPDSLKLKDLRGKFVVLSRCDGVELSYSYSGWGDNAINGSPDLDDSGCVLQDRYKSFNSKEKLRIIKSFYEKIWNEDIDNKFVINFTSCIGPYCPNLLQKGLTPNLKAIYGKIEAKNSVLFLWTSRPRV